MNYTSIYDMRQVHTNTAVSQKQIDEIAQEVSQKASKRIVEELLKAINEQLASNRRG